MLSIHLIAGVFSFFFFTHTTIAQTQPAWPEWVIELKKEAISEGISPSLFDSLFLSMKGPSQKILSFMRSQPEHRLTYPQYLNTRSGNGRIPVGQRKFQQYRKVLTSIEKQYRVDPTVIVALWGIESSYGNFMGDFPTVQALATMAYASPRADIFREELLLALHMVNNGEVTVEQFKGEWAGASGQPQFLPSSWYKYAVDYDEDGKKDIWSSVPDVLASIANYLHQHGWQPNQPQTIAVQLPQNFDPTYIQIREVKTLHEWTSLGVRQMNGQALPNKNWKAFLVHPKEGPVWLALENFQVLLSYNNSIYYAGTIDYMAHKIAHSSKQ